MYNKPLSEAIKIYDLALRLIQKLKHVIINNKGNDLKLLLRGCALLIE